MIKRLTYIVIALFLTITLASCTTGGGTTQPSSNENDVKVMQINQLIEKLPEEITLKDETRINQIIGLYDSLPTKYRAEINNYEKVLEAKTIVEELKKEQQTQSKVQNVIDEINKLPKVDELTYEDTDKVNSVKELYNALTEEEKAQITNYNTLEELLTKLENFESVMKANAQNVINAINNLPDVNDITLSNKTNVENVRVSYNNLNSVEKSYVTNLQTLEALEEKIVELEKIDAYKKEAQTVIGLINALPILSNVTLDDKTKVDEARTAYNNLSKDAKTYVSNIQKLENLESRITEIINAKSDATNVTNQIIALPNVEDADLDDKEKITAVRNAYNNLSDEAKTYVKNLDKLESLENKIYILESYQTNSILNCVSDIATSNTIDTLILENADAKFTWTSSNNNLYVISGEEAKVNMAYQTHQTQTVTVSVKITYKVGGSETKSKIITVKPILFEEMPNTPVATYFQSSATYTYKTYSTRYKTEKTLFSDKAKNVLDIVYYAFATPSKDGTIKIENTSYFNEVIKIRESGVRVVLSINGVGTETFNAFNTITKDATLINTFVKNTMDLVDANHLDGVDIDWESLDSNNVVNATQMNNLAKAFRTEMTNRQAAGGSSYLLTAAIPGTTWGAASTRFDLATLNSYLDYVNMMSYDSNKTNITTHHAPVYASSYDSGYGFGIVKGTSIFTNAGLKKAKILVGAASYGKAYKVTGTVSSTSKYPGLGVAGTLTQISGLTGSYASGTLFTNALDTLLANSNYKQYTEYNSSGQIVGSYLYNETDKIFVTYESTDTLIAKYNYVKDTAGMGIMCWAYTEDTSDYYVNTLYDQIY